MTTKSISGNSNSVKKKEIVRHDHNPFVRDMVVPSRGKNIRISRLGKEENILVNQATGEHLGTHITTVRRVDSDQFVKLFTQNIAMTFALKSAGIKAFSVLIWVLQSKAVEKDLIPLDKIVLDEFIQAHQGRKPPIKLSQPTFWRGLADLEEAKIIAKHLRQGWYYINPNFVFNGDRIAFTTLLERKTAAEESQGLLALDEGDTQ